MSLPSRPIGLVDEVVAAVAENPVGVVDRKEVFASGSAVQLVSSEPRQENVVSLAAEDCVAAVSGEKNIGTGFAVQRNLNRVVRVKPGVDPIVVVAAEHVERAVQKQPGVVLDQEVVAVVAKSNHNRRDRRVNRIDPAVRPHSELPFVNDQMNRVIAVASGQSQS